MTAYINYIVDAAHNPEITVLIASRAVAGEVNTVDLRPVLVAITFVIAPNRPQHRRPGTLNNEVAALVGFDRFAFTGHYIRLNTGERFCAWSGFRSEEHTSELQ